MNTAFTLKQATEITQRLLSAITSGDAASVRAVYAAEATIRKNYSPDPESLDEFVSKLEMMHSVVAQMWFEPIRLQITETGFVDEHIAHFHTTGGASIALMSCMVAEVSAGRIIKLTDYANSADMNPLNAEIMASLAAP